MKQSVYIGTLFALLSALAYAFQTSFIKLHSVELSVSVLLIVLGGFGVIYFSAKKKDGNIAILVSKRLSKV